MQASHSFRLGESGLGSSAILDLSTAIYSLLFQSKAISGKVSACKRSLPTRPGALIAVKNRTTGKSFPNIPCRQLCLFFYAS
jgi:hypothetical protein